ncbi:hypothetical protein MED121_05568 [Marinomonas sp. MED121]|uniref:hypothetical protein n=1 Tax=Marinomonas sp. MED121 TaxID=314277 RepID=UPI000068FBDE|nr:hypothetical protein [Marinomonas sp. MED121]EAQ63830.1 hypothetical protein MED121_05568 [Marinomonas sp. MED121]
MKLSDFDQNQNNNTHLKEPNLAWDLIFVCLILFIASSSFIYDSYLESNLYQSLKASQINLE